MFKEYPSGVFRVFRGCPKSVRRLFQGYFNDEERGGSKGAPEVFQECFNKISGGGGGVKGVYECSMSASSVFYWYTPEVEQLQALCQILQKPS